MKKKQTETFFFISFTFSAYDFLFVRQRRKRKKKVINKIRKNNENTGNFSYNDMENEWQTVLVQF